MRKAGELFFWIVGAIIFMAIMLFLGHLSDAQDERNTWITVCEVAGYEDYVKILGDRPIEPFRSAYDIYCIDVEGGEIVLAQDLVIQREVGK